jgi:hypothetical protein
VQRCVPLILVLVLVLALGCRAAPPSHVDPRTCATCHPDQAARWRDSRHDRSTQLATATSVLGDFGAAPVDDTRFERDGDAHIFAVGAQRHRVRYTLGGEPLQQYLIDGPGGRLLVFPLAWDTQRGVWFRAGEATRDRTWNTLCADCHSTAVDKRYDPLVERFDTTFAEIDVGCQACHGPGSRHAANPSEPIATSADPDTCAPCHTQRTAIAGGGRSFLDRFRPATLQDELYFADGQLRGEALQHGSFAQSVMHERGVRCIDCHDPHSGRTPAGNAVCTACHRPSPPSRFPGLARRATNVDSPAHHHHAPATRAALCVSCHMPRRGHRTAHAGHDHSMRIPRPDLSVALGTPDACTESCHAGRDSRWAAAKVAAWFPAPRPAHHGEAFDRARRGKASPDELRRLATDRGTPAIVRATAFEYLLAAAPGCLAAAASGLHDPSPLVRAAAIACGEHLAPATRALFAGDALHDPVRLVRIEAARVLAGAPVPAAQRAAFAVARRELEDAYRADLDRPDGWFHLARLAEAESRPADALAYYRRALAVDPDHEPARRQLEQIAR